MGISSIPFARKSADRSRLRRCVSEENARRRSLSRESTSIASPVSGSDSSMRPTSGSSFSRGSVMEMATKSWRWLATRRGTSKPQVRKSETRNTTDFFVMTRLRNSIAAPTSVPGFAGRKYSSSRITRSTWFLPFLGGMYFSTSEVNMMSPTLSLFLIAENASSAHSSTATSSLKRDTEPKWPDELASTTSITVSSRSSTCFLTYGCPMRAVTFQSMERTSSPSVYVRTSENSMPRPLNTLWYSPDRMDSTILRVRISIRRTFCKTSFGIIVVLR